MNDIVSDLITAEAMVRNVKNEILQCPELGAMTEKQKRQITLERLRGHIKNYIIPPSYMFDPPFKVSWTYTEFKVYLMSDVYLEILENYEKAAGRPMKIFWTFTHDRGEPVNVFTLRYAEEKG